MGSIIPHPKLFTSLCIGDITLSHRIVQSPLTRLRNGPGGIPTELSVEYYTQRTTLGGLQISEGTQISHMAGNLLGAPNIYKPEHIQGWKVVTDAIHARGGYIFCQLWHTGRFAVSMQLDGRQPLSASATNAEAVNRFTPKGGVPTETAKEMTLEDIKETIADYVHAARCAIEAGFDGVEITAGNGWLPDQFLNANSNLRTDSYGGSVENRARFVLELIDAVGAEVGPSKTAVRYTPFEMFVIALESDPIATYSYVVSETEKRGLAYVCLKHPRTDMFLDEAKKWEVLHSASNSGEIKIAPENIHLRHFTKLLVKTPIFVTGNYDGKNCFAEVESGELEAVTFGRWFISNPNLVERIRHGWELTPYKKETFYSGGREGYTDYPIGNGKKV